MSGFESLDKGIQEILARRAAEMGLSADELYNGHLDDHEEQAKARDSHERHPNLDLFVADIVDFAPKDAQAQMEAPIFALATRRDAKTFKWEHRGNSLEIIPSALGRATIFDKDVLIYLISQLATAMDRGQEIKKEIVFKPYDLLVATNRQTSGRGYTLLKEAIKRLTSTTISLNYKLGKKRIDFTGHLIDEAKIVTEEDSEELAGQVSVRLSNILYEAVKNSEILTLSRDYFQLRKPIERRLYELARKHCGKQRSWTVRLDTLHHKSGSQSSKRKFKFLLNGIIETQSLPEYLVEMDEEENKVVFIRIKGRFKARGELNA